MTLTQSSKAEFTHQPDVGESLGRLVPFTMSLENLLALIAPSLPLSIVWIVLGLIETERLRSTSDQMATDVRRTNGTMRTALHFPSLRHRSSKLKRRSNLEPKA
jgi:hypothetical protein